jgi:hypothetical protein
LHNWRSIQSQYDEYKLRLKGYRMRFSGPLLEFQFLGGSFCFIC